MILGKDRGWNPRGAVLPPAEKGAPPGLAEEHSRGHVAGQEPPPLAEAGHAAGHAVLHAQGAEGLPEGEALAHESRPRSVEELHDVRREVHAPPHPGEDLVECDAGVAVLEGGGHEPVLNVHVNPAPRERDLEKSRVQRGQLRVVRRAGVELRHEEVAQVMDPGEALRGDRLEEKGDPVGADVGQGVRKPEERDGVGADVSPALEREDLHREVEGGGHGAQLPQRGVLNDAWCVPPP